jgi:hypothetical protein
VTRTSQRRILYGNQTGLETPGFVR